MTQEKNRPAIPGTVLCPLLAAVALVASAFSLTAAERFHFKRLSTNEGLSQSAVNAIAQDQDGFLWFGTQDGLNCYDGYEFRVFRHDIGDPSSISDGYVWCIAQHAGDLWIGTLHGGLNRYDRARGTFQRFQHFGGDSTSLPGNDVTCLVDDSRGALWVGTWGGGLARLDSSNQRFVSYRHRPGDQESLPDDRVRCLWEDSHGTLWVGTWNGIARVTEGEVHPVTESERPPVAKEIICIAGDGSGNILLGTNGHGIVVRGPDGLSRIPSDTMRPLCNALANRSVAFVHRDRTGRYWIGTNDSGLISWVPGRGKPASHLTSSAHPEGVTSTQVSAVFEDASGGLWFGTNGDGVRRFDRRWEQFRSYGTSLQGASSLGNGDVRALSAGQSGTVWVGTLGGGLFLFDPGRTIFAHDLVIPGHKEEVIGDKITAVICDPLERLWVGTAGDGLLAWGPGPGQFTRYKIDPAHPGGLGDDIVYALCWDHQGALWVGTGGGGLDMLDPSTRRCVHHLPSPIDSTTISGSTVYSLYEDREQNLWVGTWGRGLNVLDPSRSRFTRYLHDPGDSTSLSSNTVLCFLEDETGTMWIGTQGGGLDRFETTRRRFTHLTDKNGLPNNVVNSILPDRYGRLWISTNRGISCFNSRTGVFRNFDVRDGLQNNEFNVGASFASDDGTMYFGGIEGLTVFHPDSIQGNDRNPPVILTSFKTFDRPVHFDRPVSAIRSVELSYAENFFSFEFVSLDFFNPQKTLYRYRMEGFDREWVNAGQRRYASYTHLDPGDYVFRVNASNDAGLWDESGPAVHVRIVPPFWQTWWFRIISALAVVGLGAVVYRTRVRILEDEKRTQQEFSTRLISSQENERKRIAGELHDSLGQNLLVIRNRALMGLKDTGLSIQARDQFDQISSVATQAIDEVRGISYGLRPYQLDRLGLTKAIGSITSGLAAPVRFSMNVEPIDDEVTTEHAIHVYRIVQEGINNILKHARATEAQVSVRVESDTIRITISDNGKGTRLEQPGTTNSPGGLGLAGISERAKILNGIMSVESKPGEGTTLTVVIPRLVT